MGWDCPPVAGLRAGLLRLGTAQPTRWQPPSQLCSSLLGPGVPDKGECGLGGSVTGLVQGTWCSCPYPRCSGGLAPLKPRMIIWTSPQVGDFAILLRAGFDRWSAAKLQLSTALGGLLGACFAICTQSPKGVGMGVVGRGPQPKGTDACPWCPGWVPPPVNPAGGDAVNCTCLLGAPSQLGLLFPWQRRL